MVTIKLVYVCMYVCMYIHTYDATLPRRGTYNYDYNYEYLQLLPKTITFVHRHALDLNCVQGYA
jgi:hypothetical protein